MHNLTDVDTFTDPVPAIQDGDSLANSTLEPTAQALANRTRLLRNRTYGAETGDQLPIPMAVMLNSNARFGFGHAFGTNPAQGWEQVDCTDGGGLWFDLSAALPKKGRITGIAITLAGTSGHAGLPGTMPRITLLRQDQGDPTTGPTTVGTTVDSSATVAAYEVGHSVAVACSEAFENLSLSRYYLKVEGETGANSAAGLKITEVVALVEPS